MKNRNLEAVRYIIKEATGLEITYAWEDLVFPEHMAFLIQFDDHNANKFYCFFHKDCPVSERKQLFGNLEKTAATDNFTLVEKGAFSLQQKGEEVEISFQ